MLKATRVRYRIVPAPLAALDIGLIKDLSIILAGVVAVTTFFTGALEYGKRGRQERAEHFVQMRRRFLEATEHREILDMLQANDPAIAQYSIQLKRNFVGFLEEVALMVNSGLIKQQIAHYMFGYYVLLVDRNEAFWVGMDRNSEYWTLFRRFAAEMKKVEEHSEALKF